MRISSAKASVRAAAGGGRALVAALWLWVPLLRGGEAAENGGARIDFDPPLPFRSGSIVWAERRTAPVLWRDMDAVLLKGRFSPEESDDDTLTRRAPEPGTVFVIVGAKLADDRSLGRPDYHLAHQDDVFPCLAISRDRLPFDARRWVVEDRSGDPTVTLLYQVPDNLRRARLVSALPTTLPLRDVSLQLLSDPSADPDGEAPLPEDSPEKETTMSAAEPEDGAAEAEETSAEDDPAADADPPERDADGMTPEPAPAVVPAADDETESPPEPAAETIPRDQPGRPENEPKKETGKGEDDEASDWF